MGAVPPKPNVRRHYATMSSVHAKPTARNFLKAMILLNECAEEMIKEILPDVYERQLQILSKTPKKWRLGNMFTSSISNYNISAPCHIDRANLKNTVNVIITKRKKLKLAVICTCLIMTLVLTSATAQCLYIPLGGTCTESRR